MRPTMKLLIPALAISLTLAACGSSSNSSGSSATSASTPASAPAASTTTATAGAGGVSTASNAALRATVLVDAQGRTLYHLSGEHNGRFLCTSSACVAAWPPVSSSATSTALGGLETVKRPDGSEQLAYGGEPLYTFVGDKAAGEANGQGVKADGGTWSAVTAGAAATATTTPASSGGEGSGGSSSGGGTGY